jgi:hypothetical protein
MNSRSAVKELIHLNPKVFLNFSKRTLRCSKSEHPWWSHIDQNKGKVTEPTLQARTRSLMSCLPNFQFVRSMMRSILGVFLKIVTTMCKANFSQSIACPLKKRLMRSSFDFTEPSVFRDFENAWWCTFF